MSRRCHQAGVTRKVSPRCQLGEAEWRKFKRMLKVIWETDRGYIGVYTGVMEEKNGNCHIIGVTFGLYMVLAAGLNVTSKCMKVLPGAVGSPFRWIPKCVVNV